jgi:hypothetical protein
MENHGNGYIFEFDPMQRLKDRNEEEAKTNLESRPRRQHHGLHWMMILIVLRQFSFEIVSFVW